MKALGLLVSLLFPLLAVCHGQERFQSRAGTATANVELPAHVKAADGIVTLWADFERAAAEGVPLYLVNKTSSAASFRHEDGDIYIMLETKNATGKWTRAQTHEYSWCGNSYGTSVLPPGMHYRIFGYRPASGRTADVRFAMHSDQLLVSNLGKGNVSDQDVEAARFDGMSLRDVPGSLVTAFDKEDRRRPTPEHMANCLQLLQVFGDVPALRRAATQQVEAWRSNSATTIEEERAAAQFEQILAASWPEEVSPERLFQHCMAKLKETPHRDQALSALHWVILRDLANWQFRSRRAAETPLADIPSDHWRAVTELAVFRFANAMKDEAEGICGILSMDLLVDNFVASGDLEPMLQVNPHDQGAKIAANALARRGMMERLAELGMKLPPASQIDVLGAMASHRVRQGFLEPIVMGPKEETFWKEVFTNKTLEACDELYLRSDHRRDALLIFGPMVLDHVRAYWRQQMERSNAATEDFPLSKSPYATCFAVEVLAKSKDKVDIPLLRSLLTYRGYNLHEWIQGYGSENEKVSSRIQHFAVRRAALEALISLGEPVPQDVIIERDVTDTAHVIEKTYRELK